ncbi:MAG: enoyl-CoA hydratase [Thermodesulfobacteriota bacterium]|nr:MAG: enoyl-CoA hydratase [Thermodesulfobacteriota bacterium]
MTELKELLVEENGAVCTLILNRPEKRNLLNPSTLKLLDSELVRLKQEDKVRCVVLRGSGDKAFSSGYDISAIGENDMIKHHDGDHTLGKALKTIESFPYPVIAMMNGHAFGAGLEVAVTCDIRITVDDCLFGMPPAKLGVVYSYSGMKKFLDLIGPGYTKELFLIGRPISSERATEIGLINFMVSKENIEEFTYEMANEIAENAPLSLKTLKEITNALGNRPISDEDEKLIRTMTLKVQNSQDYKEGQKAFSEKRKPEFKGE